MGKCSKRKKKHLPFSPPLLSRCGYNCNCSISFIRVFRGRLVNYSYVLPIPLLRNTTTTTTNYYYYYY